jgi:guanine deaminase
MDPLMKAAIEEARSGFNRDDGGPFGAIIVRDGKLIAKAHNEVLQEWDAKPDKVLY